MKIFLALFLVVVGVAFGDNRALVMGCCENYKYLKDNEPLYGTINDAEYIRDILLRQGAVAQSDMEYLVAQDASFANIKHSLERLKKADFQRGDKLYLYFSGHGTSLSNTALFGQDLIKYRDVKKWIENSTGLVPWDYNPNSLSNSLLITKRDFRPLFEALDAKGVEIVWIVDACYAGNSYRGGASKSKFITLDTTQRQEFEENFNKEPPNYKHLIFYGASLSTNPSQEILSRGKKRGELTVEIERCIEALPNTKISHGAMQKCLKQNYINYTNHNYPPSFYPRGDELAESFIINGSPITSKPQKSYKQRLFELSSDNPLLELSIHSQNAPNAIIRSYCKGELISIELGRDRGRYIIVLTIDSEGRVVRLPSGGSKVVVAEVQKPFGKDRLKIFTTENKAIYDSLSSYQDALNGEAIESIYKKLQSDKTLRTASTVVETISTDISECIRGD